MIKEVIPVIQIVAKTKPEKFINVGVDRLPKKIKNNRCDDGNKFCSLL